MIRLFAHPPAHRRRATLFAVIATVLLLIPATHAAETKKRGPGWVDKTTFMELAGGEQAVRVEVSLHSTLIKLFCAGLEEELKEVACGLESIDALVLDAAGDARVERIIDVIRKTEKDLIQRGWERIARVREESSEVSVLILNTEEEISGLVVMVLEKNDGELVFVNVAGKIDLEALQRIAGEWNLPGLEDIDGWED